jgi:hypothetical protein
VPELIEFLGRALVGAIFLITGVGKWRLGTRAFAHAIEGYRLLPGDLPVGVARLLPALEIAVGVGLLLGGAGLFVVLAVTLLILFAVAMAVGLAHGLTVDCGCATFVQAPRVSWKLVYRNLVLAALLVPAAPEADGFGIATLTMVVVASVLLGAVHGVARLGGSGAEHVAQIGGR